MSCAHEGTRPPVVPAALKSADDFLAQSSNFARLRSWRTGIEPLFRLNASWKAGLIIDLILRLKDKGGLSIVMIMHNYAQTLDIADRIMLMQRGRVTYEQHSAKTSVPELMDIVRREYRAMREATNSTRA